METLNSTVGFTLSCNRSATDLSSRLSRIVGLPSRGKASPCSVQYTKHFVMKPLVTSVIMRQKERERSIFVKCRNNVSGTAEVAENDRDLGIQIQRKKLAVFVSGGGSNFRAIHEATTKGLVYGDVTVLVTDKPGCGGAQYANDNQIPVLVFPKSKSSPDGLSLDNLVASLRKFDIDFLLLAGFLKLIPVELVRAYPKSILNIHPSLLPAFGGKGFYGSKVHKAVITSGARYSGPTIHFVDEEYDTGRILAQRVVPVLANDTVEELAARVLRQEHQIYVEVVSALCEERIIWREDGVPIIRSREDPNKLY